MLLENCPYPQDVRVRREAVALTAAGYLVSVICRAAPRQPPREIVNGVHVYRYSSPAAANSFLGYLREYGYSLAASIALSLLVLFREGFDVIHAHNPPDIFVFIALFYKIFGKRFVFDHHDLSPEMYQARFPGKASPVVYSALVFLEKLTCLAADHVIATNESYKRMELERGGVSPHRITVVRNGIELSRLRHFEPDPGLLQKGKIVIGYVGVMGYQDGLDYLLRALNHLRRDLGRTDFYAILIGDGDAWTNLKKLSSYLDLDEFVWLPGAIFGDDLRHYLSAADICVVPDPSNGYNDRSTMVKMMEYMALEKPIVAFDLPENRFTAQQCALYVQPNNELEFAKAMVQLMDDPTLRKSLGAHGIHRLRTALAWDYSVSHLLDAYAKVAPFPACPTPTSLPRKEETIVKTVQCPPARSTKVESATSR